jgi:hypothetical protein
MSQQADGNQRPGHGRVTIIVNGRRHTVEKHEASFAEIVDLAFPGQVQGGNIMFTITFKRGHGDKPEGTLVEGDTVRLKDGMIFNVARTDKS